MKTQTKTDKKIKEMNVNHEEVKPTQQDYVDKWNKDKKAYLEKPENTTKSMVYENGAALSFILRELYKLNDSINQLKNQLHGEASQK